MIARLASVVLAAALLAAPSFAAAANPADYKVGNLPVAAGIGLVEFPLKGPFSAQVAFGALSQGTYDDGNPFAYLSLWSPSAWLHYDGVRNLRLSVAFQEFVYEAIPPLGVPHTHEERGTIRARIQQPRGAAALYEMAQLDVRSFDDPGGTHRVVFRPRFRVGQGFNLDQVRVQSLVLYQEIAFRFTNDDYAARAFEFFRAFAGYAFTTKRGTNVSFGLLGQISLNPAATRYDFLWGPVLGVAHRFKASPPEAPPPPPDAEVQ
jgi:hypothetical protein